MPDEKETVQKAGQKAGDARPVVPRSPGAKIQREALVKFPAVKETERSTVGGADEDAPVRLADIQN